MKNSISKLILNILVPIIICALLLLIVPRLLVYFMPFVIGFLVSLIVNPVVKFLSKHVKIKRKAGSVIMVVVALAVVVVIIWGIVVGIINIAEAVADNSSEWIASGKQEYELFIEKLDDINKSLPKNINLDIKKIIGSVGDAITAWFQKVGTSGLVEKIGEVTSNIPGILIGIIVGILSSYFFVAERYNLTKGISKHISEGLKKQLKDIKVQCFDVIGGYFKAQFKIMAVVYVILTIGLGILRTPYFPLTALGIAFVDMLPFFGTGTILGPWAVIKFIMGDYKMTICLAVLYAVTQVVRQLIQPKLLGDSIGMNPFATLFFMYIGFTSFGVLGMILAVPIAMIVINLVKSGVFDNFIFSLKELYRMIKNYMHLDKNVEE